MSKKEWMDIDIDNLDLLEVSDVEKARVKQHVLKKRKKSKTWRNIVIAAVIMVSVTGATGFAFPTIAAQIPFMNHVISYFSNEEQQIYKNFDTFSTEMGLAKTSNGITVMIDKAVYDGTNITVSYALETKHDLGDEREITARNWFRVEGADGGTFSEDVRKISNTRYVCIATFTPDFKDNRKPNEVQVTWKPEAFYSFSKDREFKGDWTFNFSLNRIEGDKLLVNKTVKNKNIDVTLSSIVFTDVSTIIAYDQIVTDEFLKKWPSVTPMFRVTDDLGHVYLEGSGGGGVTNDNGKTFKGSTTFQSIQKDANKLIIQPIVFASLMYGNGHKKIELDPIIIDLKR